MKTLYLVRHAKAEPLGSLSSDFERPLNPRGLKDALNMALRLREKSVPIDLLVSSPAARALSTCRIFGEVYGIAPDQVLLESALYHAPAFVFYDVMERIPDLAGHIAIFAHNPGITDMANTLCESVHIDQMPTGSVFAVQAPVKQWKDFRDAEKQFLFFDYPKAI